jgi:hypothetical protein
LEGAGIRLAANEFILKNFLIGGSRPIHQEIIPASNVQPIWQGMPVSKARECMRLLGHS